MPGTGGCKFYRSELLFLSSYFFQKKKKEAFIFLFFFCSEIQAIFSLWRPGYLYRNTLSSLPRIVSLRTGSKAMPGTAACKFRRSEFFCADNFQFFALWRPWCFYRNTLRPLRTGRNAMPGTAECKLCPPEVFFLCS